MTSFEQCTELSLQLGKLLQQKGWSVGTAESCTGGLLAAAITDIAGSSAWFGEGLVTYANESKQRLLGVTETQLSEHGAVSQSVVESMAAGVIARGADLALATSGIAGPDGGTPDKPVGTVWMAWATQAGVQSALQCFEGNRAQIRYQACEWLFKAVLSDLTA